MIRSMTGFASHTFTLTRGQEHSTITITIKSLNSRYFEITYKTPYIFSSLEHEITKLVKHDLMRGHVNLVVYMSNPNMFKGNIEPALHVIEGYINAMERIKKTEKISGEISLNTLITLPNIFTIEEQSIDEASKQAVLSGVRKALDIMIESQDAEGLILQADLENRIRLMREEITAIEKDSAILLEAQKQKIHQTLQETIPDESKFAEVQKNALYATLDKIDTHEEVIRFKNHLENLNALIQIPTIEKGKRLDFTLQELAREINTISAKCSDSAISSRAINIKVELEKAREQVQNII